MDVSRSRWAPIGLALAVVGGSAFGTVLVTVEEALLLAFPGSTTDRQTHFLTDDDCSAGEKLSGTELGGKMVTRFVVSDAHGVVGFGYLDTHRVRTLPETVLVILDAGGTVRRVEVVSFREPLDYMPPDGWYRQFDGKGLSDELSLKRAIRPITGASLPARSTTDAVRRMLAVHRVLSGEEPVS